MQGHLVLNYRKFHKGKEKAKSPKKYITSDDNLPVVTIQLPIFNELYVVERLIEATSKLIYPKEKLEIQILDDSTDETTQIIKDTIVSYLELGFDIKHIHRTNREGFKAGALDEGLKVARGEFIAIFDADFIPCTDFLLSTLPYFEDSKIGMVQTKWGHLNRNYSLLTRLQAFALDAHFSVEQIGRNSNGVFMNFNGTAGIWRKECINTSGGWQHDTLTEDLDLSYRAQMEGWQLQYSEDIVCPAELPVTMNALKTQQFRWMKGGAENFRKNYLKVLKNKNINRKTKLHGFFHLLNSSVFLFVLFCAVLSVPVLVVKNLRPEYEYLFQMSSLFLVSMIIVMIFYWTSFNKNYKGGKMTIIKFPVYFILFLGFSMGLSFHNSIAVIEGHLGKKSSFVRTPKFNILSKSDSWKGNKYNKRSFSLINFIEFLLAIYFISAIALSFYYGDYTMLPLHLILAFGYSSIFILTLKHRS